MEDKKKIKDARREEKRKLREAKMEKKYGDPLLKAIVEEEDRADKKMKFTAPSIPHLYYNMYKDERREIHHERIIAIVLYALTLAWFTVYLFTGVVSAAISGVVWLIIAVQIGLNARIDLINNQRTRDSISKLIRDETKEKIIPKFMKEDYEKRKANEG